MNMPMTTTTTASLRQTSLTSMSMFSNEEIQNAGINSVSLLNSSRSLHPGTTKEITSTSSHVRRDSFATTESAESSPTTTISTIDSSITDPSSSSSPESPHGSTLKNSLSDQTPTLRSMESIRKLSLDVPPSNGLDSSNSPNKRPRNAKGLSISTAGISTIGTRNLSARSERQSSISSPGASISKFLPSRLPSYLGTQNASRPFSEPSSPAFIVPQFPPPKRSKLGLTITTPDSNGVIGTGPQTPLRGMTPLSLRTRSIDLTAKLNPVPETPVPLSSMRENDEGRPLFSPSMAPYGGMQLPPFGRMSDPTLPTPSFGPEGGMTFPTSGSSQSSPYSRVSKPPLSLSRTSFDSPNSSSVIQHTIEHIPSTPLHDLPLSQEAKSPGYPDGPICIYPPNVYLYHQPTRKEARNFDVIINVAREVLNPFLEPEAPEISPDEPKYKDASVQCMLLVGPGENVPEPQSAISATSFSSALEGITDEQEPTTPRATSPQPTDPEYIHLPWEHNSKVYQDWLKICELIDDRVNDDKKVLIHCQLGVSRSASLVVAYGIFKNPQLTPDEAREQAKNQSRYIDLNMHFMYELGDFKKLLADRYPQNQLPIRPSIHKASMRTMTDSILTMSSSYSRDTMTPMLNEAGKHTTRKQSTDFSRAGSNLNGPSSAPDASHFEADGSITTRSASIPSTEPGLEESVRAGDKPEDIPLKLSLPSLRTLPTGPSIRTNLSNLPQEPANSECPHIGDDLKSPQPLHLTLPTRLHIENLAQNTNSLPPPHLELPSTQPFIPRRTIRPMPSLPAGFSSMSRRGNDNQALPFSDLKLSIESLKSPMIGPGEDILSPRILEFSASSFHRSVRSLAGDLAEGPSSYLSAPLDHNQDPRSPPIKGEITMLRNIDDIIR